MRLSAVDWGPEVRMDWTGCEFVERVEGRCSGAPTVVGTRVFPDAIVGSYELGERVEDIHADYPTVPVDTIRGLIRFVRAQRAKTAA